MNTRFRFAPQEFPYSFFYAITLNFSIMRLLLFLLPFEVSRNDPLIFSQSKRASSHTKNCLAVHRRLYFLTAFESFTDIHTIPLGFLQFLLNCYLFNNKKAAGGLGLAFHFLMLALACAMSPTQLWELRVEEGKDVDVGCCGRKACVCAARSSGCYYTEVIFFNDTRSCSNPLH